VRVYWHILTKKRKKEIMNSGMTMAEFMKQYKQPSWCDYPDALESLMGCWSLMVSLTNVSKKYCNKCDCYIFPAHGNAKRKGSFRDLKRIDKKEVGK
jgi:hypothetical protein